MDAEKNSLFLTTASRSPFLAQNVVIVDGVPGCGKTMLSPIIGALARVELLTYAYAVEHMCALYYLGRVEEDAAITMVRMLTDLQLYNLMMARETNFRPSDLSSVFRSASPLRYLRRLLLQGDEAIPQRMRDENPILHLTTHTLLGMGEPVVKALGKRLTVIEVVRHPLYMLKQQMLNMERLLLNARHFTIYGKYREQEIPFWAFGWEENFLKSNAVDRAIYAMDFWTRKVEQKTEKLTNQFGARIITVPFEQFVINPWPYMEQIAQELQTSITSRTRKEMSKQHVPRKKFGEGVSLRIYKRCGFEPAGKNTTEKDEFTKRKRFAVEQGASREALHILDELSIMYEKTYMRGLMGLE